jgi:Family of unknown function (DUF6629)
MCFSADASFAAGAALIPVGGICVAMALRKRPALLPLALVPIFFGLQQLSEGFVWLGLHDADTALTRPASLVFLFFALAFWPFWFPLITAVAETQPRKRVIFRWLTVISAVWFFVLYLPIITGPESVLTTRVAHHSIQYDYDGLAIYRYISKPLLRVAYFMCVALPMLFGSESLGKLPGLFFAVSAVISALVFSYAFVSVWCFFAALLSAYLCWMFYHLPAKAQAIGTSHIAQGMGSPVQAR